MMKFLLTTLLFLVDLSASAQINQFKEENVYAEKMRQLHEKNKLKEEDDYFSKHDNCKTCPDSTLHRRIFYNERGNVYRRVTYSNDTHGGAGSEHRDTVEYDVSGRILKTTYFLNAQMPHYDKYIYDSNGLLIERNGITYAYNKRGNVISSQRKGISMPVSRYEYNEKDQVINYWLVRSTNGSTISRETYTYIPNKTGITQTVNFYEGNDTLPYKKEYNYDRTGNLLSEYKVTKDQKTLTRSFVYNADGQYAESLWPTTGMYPKNIRDKIFEHKLYTYDANGNVATIATYEKNIETGTESLLFFEKKHYICR